MIDNQIVDGALDGKNLSRRKPCFGEWLRGIYASADNPTRDGMYVRTIRLRGKVNKGIFFELTDGKGRFWRTLAASTIFLTFK